MKKEGEEGKKKEKKKEARGKRNGGRGVVSLEHHNVYEMYVLVTCRLVCPGKYRRNLLS